MSVKCVDSVLVMSHNPIKILVIYMGELKLMSKFFPSLAFAISDFNEYLTQLCMKMITDAGEIEEMRIILTDRLPTG